MQTTWTSLAWQNNGSQRHCLAPALERACCKLRLVPIRPESPSYPSLMTIKQPVRDKGLRKTTQTSQQRVNHTLHCIHICAQHTVDCIVKQCEAEQKQRALKRHPQDGTLSASSLNSGTHTDTHIQTPECHTPLHRQLTALKPTQQ